MTVGLLCGTSEVGHDPVVMALAESGGGKRQGEV